jgi:hypothetical protein
MSYNLTSFANNPEVANSPGLLYVLVLVNKKTNERECLKIGITKGSTFRDTLKRAAGFNGYEIRIQKLVKGTLLEVYNLEQTLHSLYDEFRFNPQHKFGGHTECFKLDILKDVLKFLRE